MRFQIALEGEGFVFPLEGTVKLDLPRSKLRGVWTASLVVGRQALSEVLCEPDVGLIGVGFAPNNINVEHSPCSVSLRQIQLASLLVTFLCQ
jgi:hypothetical protein